MKCPICGGRGFVYNALGGFNEDCGICDGTGEIYIPPQEQEPLTNDEWRKTCSAEEFADFLAGVAHAGAYEVRNCNTNGMLQTQNIDFWLEWLKQPHNRKDDE